MQKENKIKKYGKRAGVVVIIGALYTGWYFVSKYFGKFVGTIICKFWK